MVDGTKEKNDTVRTNIMSCDHMTLNARKEIAIKD